MRKGPRPAWLDAACDIQIKCLTAGSAVIALEAPTVRDADGARFGLGAQGSLFDDVDGLFGEQTAIDIFGNVLASLVEAARTTSRPIGPCSMSAPGLPAYRAVASKGSGSRG